MLLEFWKNSLASRLTTYFALLSEAKCIAALAATNLIGGNFVVLHLVISELVDVLGDHEVISHASRTGVAPNPDDLGFSPCHRFKPFALE